MRRDEALALALDFSATLDLPVGPIALTVDPVTGKIGKRPLTRRGFHDFSRDPFEIRETFSTIGTDIEVGVGAVPGPRYLVLDIDSVADQARVAAYDLPATLTVATPSGGVHLWFASPDPTLRIGTRSQIDGVDVVRSSDGMIVAPGTASPWGTWSTHDDLATDIAVASADLMRLLEIVGDSTTPSRGSVLIRGDRAVRDHLRAEKRDQDLETLDAAMASHGFHSPFITANGSVQITGPHKNAGVSASIGYSVPGVLVCFTSSISGLRESGHYVAGPGGTLIDADDTSWITVVHREVITDPARGSTLQRIDFSRIDDRGDPIIRGILEPSRWTALASAPKIGKSTLIGNIAINLSIGLDPFDGRPRPLCRVLLLDAEMGALDQRERIEDAGFEPTDLVDLHVVDQVPALDTADGARRVLTYVDEQAIDVVIIDGLNSTLAGEENSDVTYRSLFDGLIAPLKRRKVAVLTASNLGKNPALGPRGSSLQVDKPDAVLTLARTERGLRAEALVRRSHTFDEEIIFEVTGLDDGGPVRIRRAETALPEGTERLIATLDREGIPLDWSRRKVARALRERNLTPGRNEVLSAALRLRRQRDTDDAVRRLTEPRQ